MFKQTIISILLLSSSLLSVTANDVPPSCLLDCLNKQEDVSAYKEICSTDAGVVLTCLAETCTGDFFKDAETRFVDVCKGKGHTVDVKKATATMTTESSKPTGTKTSTGSDPTSTDDADSENAGSASDSDDGDDAESSAAKISAGFIGIAAAVMGALAL